jgi:hypothetical protein
VIRTSIPPPLLPKNPQPTGDDDFRNLIPPLVTNHPEYIHLPHSFHLLLLLNRTCVCQPNTSTSPKYCSYLQPGSEETQFTNPPPTQTENPPGKPRITMHVDAHSRVRSRIWSTACQDCKRAEGRGGDFSVHVYDRLMEEAGDGAEEECQGRGQRRIKKTEQPRSLA